MVGLNRSFQQIRNQSENKDMPEKPNCNLDFLQLFFFIISISNFNRYN